LWLTVVLQKPMPKTQRKTSKPARKVRAANTEDRPESERQFVEGLAIRGEAARAENGALPAGATHEVIEEKENGAIVVKRQRFSAY
jgi:hypothetical protein